MQRHSRIKRMSLNKETSRKATLANVPKGPDAGNICTILAGSEGQAISHHTQGYRLCNLKSVNDVLQCICLRTN